MTCCGISMSRQDAAWSLGGPHSNRARPFAETRGSFQKLRVAMAAGVARNINAGKAVIRLHLGYFGLGLEDLGGKVRRFTGPPSHRAKESSHSAIGGSGIHAHCVFRPPHPDSETERPWRLNDSAIARVFICTLGIQSPTLAYVPPRIHRQRGKIYGLHFGPEN